MAEKVYTDLRVDEFIKNTARKRATDVMDADDLEQELWVFYLENLEGRDYHDATVIDLIRKQATKVTRNERIDYMYFRGAFIYTPSMVRAMLADAVWCEVEDAFDIEGRVDVTRALGRLSINTQRLLFDWFACGNRTDHSTTKSAVSRAVDAITHELNTHSGASEVDPTWVVDPDSGGWSKLCG